MYSSVSKPNGLGVARAYTKLAKHFFPIDSSMFFAHHGQQLCAQIHRLNYLQNNRIASIDRPASGIVTDQNSKPITIAYFKDGEEYE